MAKSSKKPLDVLFRLPEKTSEKTFFPAFRWRKAAKATRPIPMAASGRLKAASGDYSRVCKQPVPAALAFSPPSAFPPSEPSRGSPCGKKECRGALPYRKNAANGGTTNPHSRLTWKKRGRAAARPSRGGAKAPILRAPCSAAARALPRRTTCGGFWYFWPQKYKKKKVCENCDLPEPSQTFSVKFRKTFFSAFRWRKAAKATRPIPMAASGRLKAASGDYSRVCKQTVPAAVAFSPPSTLSPSEPSRGGVAYKKIKKNRYFVLHNTKIRIIFAL